MQKESKKTFWRNINFKYKVYVINSNKLEEVAKLSISKLNALSLVIFTSLLIFLISSAIIIFTPLRYYLPGYVNSEIRSQIVANKVYADSIANELIKQSAYIDNLREVMKGGLTIDSVKTSAPDVAGSKDTLMTPSPAEMAFRHNYENNEKYSLTNNIISQTRLNGVSFARPLYGTVAKPFATGHSGIDIAVDSPTNVCSVLDGTVVYTGHPTGEGYTIIIQHSNNVTSIYRDCERLLKESGMSVKSGDAIAITTPGHRHLHLEIWHNGHPLDPTKYIAF